MISSVSVAIQNAPISSSQKVYADTEWCIAGSSENGYNRFDANREWGSTIKDAQHLFVFQSPPGTENAVLNVLNAPDRTQFEYFGEVDHLIPWQIDHLIVWRPVAEKSCEAVSKLVN